MTTLPRPEIDEHGLLEYSVVYTDRALNHMSQKFQTALREISATLKKVYGADYAAVVPGPFEESKPCLCSVGSVANLHHPRPNLAVRGLNHPVC